MNEITRPQRGHGRLRIRIGLFFTLAGFLIFLIGVKPEIFGLDRSPVTGFLQIAVFLVGLGGICIGGYISLDALWNGTQKTIGADIGLRLVSTGFVIAFVSGMADVLGFGNHSMPKIPYFGAWQAVGVILAELVIASGFLLLIPYHLSSKD